MAIYALMYKKYENWCEIHSIEDQGTHTPEAANPWIYKEVSTFPAPPSVGEWYDLDTDTLQSEDPRPAVEQPAVQMRFFLTPFDFWYQRFTDTERAKVWAVCNGEDVPGVTISLENRYRLAAWRDLTVSGEKFWYNDAEGTIVINALETAGVLAAGRAAEILTLAP